MSWLEELQLEFIDGVFGKSTNILSRIKSLEADEIDVQDRLGVYRNTIYNGLCHALSVIYPGIWKLLGKECADRAALLYFNNFKNLPNTGCLDKCGKGFSKFLASVPAFKGLPYLADYAWYEYLHHQAYCGYGKSAHFFESKFPIDEIQNFLENCGTHLQLSQKPSYAIIMRPQEKVLTVWVDQQKWHSLQLQEKTYA